MIQKNYKIFGCIIAFIILSGLSNSAQASTPMQYYYGTASLVNDSGTIYFINGVTKIPFTNWQAFVGLGYSLQNVVRGNLENYLLSEGYRLSTSEMAHPWGSWLLLGGTVYYSSPDGLIGVPSVQVFTANGGNFKYVVPVNKYDLAVLNASPRLSPLTVNDSRMTVLQTPDSNSIITTKDSLNITTGQYSTIAFQAHFLYQTFAPIVFTFTQTGGVPGMKFEGYPCNKPGVNSCIAIASTDTLFLDGVPTTAGSFPVTLSAKDAAGNISVAAFTVVVSQ